MAATAIGGLALDTSHITTDSGTSGKAHEAALPNYIELLPEPMSAQSSIEHGQIPMMLLVQALR